MPKECYICGFFEDDIGCFCPSTDSWYACSLENKKPENIQFWEDLPEFQSKEKLRSHE